MADDEGTSITELRISGMHCAACSSNVAKALRNVEGVEAADVNLATEIATVSHLDVSPDDLKTAVEEAGFGVVSDHVDIRIGGMHCASCVANVTKALHKVDGISEANVNLATETATIEYDPRSASLGDMKTAIEDLGFKYLGLAGEARDAAEEEHRADLRSKFRRIVMGFAVSIPMMAVMHLRPELPLPMGILMFAISLPFFVYLAYPIFSAAFSSLSNRHLDMDVMYAMGIGVAYGSSVLGTFRIVLTPHFMFYDTALMLASFLTLGRYLEARAKGRTSDAIRKLMDLRPDVAIVLRDGQEVEVPVDEVRKGDTVVVKPGSRVPVDGKVIDGSGTIDESMMTGEPMPVVKDVGADVTGGTLVRNGLIRFEATAVGRDTALFRIIEMVERAQGSRPPVQRLADRAVTVFIPAVLTIAIVAFLGWYLVGGSTLLFALTTAIAVLVIACPCALGLATPTAVTVGVGRGAELGILIKEGEALERADDISVVLFDKTGTLTEGEPRVTDVVTYGVERPELLGMAAAVEAGSQHPLAEAVVNAAKEEAASAMEATGFETVEGKGISAAVGVNVVSVGNRSMMEERSVSIDGKVSARMAKMEMAGKTVIAVASGSEVVGLIAVSDPVKGTSRKAVKVLKGMGIDVAMVTGDNPDTAGAVARRIGIQNVHAGVLPGGKADVVRRMQESGEVVAFVGDGINDAPALAQADVGIAIGSGTDVAVEAGEVVLVGDDPLDTAAAVQLGRKVMSRIRGNLFWAFAYNTALIPLAAGMLFPVTGWTFRPELGAMAMALSSFSVISLSLLLRKWEPAK